MAERGEMTEKTVAAAANAPQDAEMTPRPSTAADWLRPEPPVSSAVSSSAKPAAAPDAEPSVEGPPKPAPAPQPAPEQKAAPPAKAAGAAKPAPEAKPGPAPEAAPAAAAPKPVAANQGGKGGGRKAGGKGGGAGGGAGGGKGGGAGGPAKGGQVMTIAGQATRQPVAQPKNQPAAKARPGGGPLRARPGMRLAPLERIRARPRPRHALLIASFFVLVVAPAIFANWYLHAVSADQYASNLAFTIQSDQSVDTGGLFDVLAGGGGSADDAEVLYGFIRSQNMVETLEGDLGLRTMFNKPEDDWWFRLGDDPSIEHLVDYWKTMALVAFDAGIVEVEVRAFDPEDAQRIASAVLAESTRQINRMSAEAREDAVRDARESLELAIIRQKEVRAELARMRASDQSVNPSFDVTALMNRIGELEAELTRQRLRLDQLREFAPETDSRVEAVRRRIASLTALIADERSALAGGDGQALSNSVGRFEELTVDLELAQEAYSAALRSFEIAKAEARRKQRYLSAHIAPTLSQSPQYPQRYILGGLATFFLFMGWVVLVMISYNIRDRR